jgi:hypothetical protein
MENDVYKVNALSIDLCRKPGDWWSSLVRIDFDDEVSRTSSLFLSTDARLVQKISGSFVGGPLGFARTRHHQECMRLVFEKYENMF